MSYNNIVVQDRGFEVEDFFVRTGVNPEDFPVSAPGLVARWDGLVVGVLSCFFDDIADDGVAEYSVHVFVDPEYRRLRVARRLIARAMTGHMRLAASRGAATSRLVFEVHNSADDKIMGGLLTGWGAWRTVTDENVMYEVEVNDPIRTDNVVPLIPRKPPPCPPTPPAAA